MAVAESVAVTREMTSTAQHRRPTRTSRLELYIYLLISSIKLVPTMLSVFQPMMELLIVTLRLAKTAENASVAALAPRRPSMTGIGSMVTR